MTEGEKPMKQPLRFASLVLTLLFPLIAKAQDDAYPITIGNCGFEATFHTPAERAITMNQGATEIMLALMILLIVSAPPLTSKMRNLSAALIV